MMHGTTELDVGNMSADLCTRNILDQKSSNSNLKGMFYGPEHASNVKPQQFTHNIGKSVHCDIFGE